jgi:hypothetical protein
MRSFAKIKHWEAECVYTHMREAHHLFQRSHCQQMAQVALRAEMAHVVVDVHLCHCAYGVSVDCVRCHLGKEDSCLFDFREPLPGVFRWQPSPCSALDNLHPTSSLLGLRREVSRFIAVFPLLWHMKTLLWPFWPNSRQDACQTVQAVPNLLVLP